MARFSGKVGYITQEETTPGVWTPKEKSRTMKGDIIRQVSNYTSGESVNDDISLNHRVSLVGDAYAFGNYFNMKWIQIDSQKWKISSIEVQRPRLIVTVGGLWNE